MRFLHIFLLTGMRAVLPTWRSGVFGVSCNTEAMALTYKDASSAAAFSCNGTITTQENRDMALVVHNLVRTNLQRGALLDNVGKTYPPAKNMYKLKWDCDYEKIADGIVQGCQQALPAQLPPDHAVNFHAFPYNNGASYIYDVVTTSVGGWGFQGSSSAATNKYNSNIKELSNILNSATFTVGCSAQLCGGGIVATIACIYEQRALTDGEVMYEEGPYCQSDSDCTARTPAVCDKANYLCEMANLTTPVPTTTTTPTTHSTTGAFVDTGINRICPSNSNMNDRIRVKALDMHNYRRSQLAIGAVAKFNGNKLPTAANMVKLTYDCGLESTAFAHAATCSNTYSNRTMRESVEENIQLVPTTSTFPYRIDAVGEAIKTWWRQIRLQTQAIGMTVTFKDNHVDQPISYFTMMAWATTTRLGCGVSRCGDNFFVVCHYQPGGNIVRSRVYDPGEPCSKCPTGTYCVSPLCSTV